MRRNERRKKRGHKFLKVHEDTLVPNIPRVLEPPVFRGLILPKVMRAALLVQKKACHRLVINLLGPALVPPQMPSKVVLDDLITKLLVMLPV